IDAPECLPRRLPIFRQAARLNSLTVSAKELRFEVHCVSFRPTRVRNESATIWTATFGLRGSGRDRHPEAVLVDPPVLSAARSLPLPHLNRCIGVTGVMEASTGQGRRLIRKRRWPHMKCAIPRHNGVGLRQQDGKLILVILMRIGDVVAILKNVPTIIFLDQRQMLE